jgi:hypothetical protein
LKAARTLGAARTTGTLEAARTLEATRTLEAVKTLEATRTLEAAETLKALKVKCGNSGVSFHINSRICALKECELVYLVLVLPSKSYN